MLEKDLGHKLRDAFAAKRILSLKCWGSEMMRAFPDWLVWGDGAPLWCYELKRAETYGEGKASLTPGQRSVLASWAKTMHGVGFVWMSECGRVGGWAWLKSAAQVKGEEEPAWQQQFTDCASSKELAWKIVDEICECILHKDQAYD